MSQAEHGEGKRKNSDYLAVFVGVNFLPCVSSHVCENGRVIWIQREVRALTC